ncbi:tyrosine-type recombinase/integrase [Brevundimonas sp. BH3]
MPKATLDYAFVSQARCLPGQNKTVYYDTTISGFTLECRASGGRTYYLRYRDPSDRLKQIKIGGFNDVTIAQARKKAQQLRAEVVMGGDPLATKKEVKAIPLCGVLLDMYLEDSKARLKSHDTNEMYVRIHIRPKWGKVPVNEIETRAVAAWLQELGKTLAPATVEKIRVIMGRAYQLGQNWGVPGTDRNPTRGIARKPLNNARDRFLTADEAERLREACIVSNNPQLQHIVGLLLLTGARKRELLDAKWENIDLARRSWFIPTTKTGKPRHVPLSQAAIDIIESLPRFKDCPWLVPNPDTLKPFVSIKNAWAYAIKTANLPGLRIHDLRHSAASFMVNSGVDLFAVGKVLGHASYQSTQRYSHLANDTLLKAVEAGAAKHKAW